ncbi:MAG TPA: hypothetical protein VMI12_01295 [Puia sp.]|nr:hypothetical protein [Puia sp.]
MDNELFNIFSQSDKNIDASMLMDYLNGKLSGKEKYEMEKLIAENDLLHDAIEGLEKVQDKKKLQLYVDQLNQDLHRHLQKPKLRREKKRIKEYPWIYLTIILILSICIIAYLVIRQFLH